MNINESASYRASVDQLVAILTDRQFQASKADALGAQEFTMTVAGTAQQPEVTTLRRFPTRSLPEFVKALVNPTMLVTERERWAAATGTESRHASFDVDVDGAPIRVRGSLVVQASDGDTTTVRFYGELQSTVPLFRKQVEVAGSAEVLRTIRTELALLETEIAARHGFTADRGSA